MEEGKNYLNLFIKRKKIIIVTFIILIIFTTFAFNRMIKKQKINNSLKLIKDPEDLIDVGFASSRYVPTDDEIKKMIDNAVKQVLGDKGLAAIIKAGDKVVIKVNIVETYRGKKGEKGRGIITDPRVVRYVAEKVREIIGYEGTADLKVVDAVQYKMKNPSLKQYKTSFYWARLEKTGDNNVDKEDICYDYNADGILDGTSNAQLVNLDSISIGERYFVEVNESTLGAVKVYMPKFLRTRQEAGDSDEYCDVLIGLPVFKSHGFTGMTGAIKLHYGFRYLWQTGDEGGRIAHSGYGWGTGNKQLLNDYLCAQNKVRKYDLVVMDCLTGNRRGPVNTDFKNPDSYTDYILTNAVLCSKDSVAIDTVETLFAGYDYKSVQTLISAYLDGLGINKPEFINIIGLTKFTEYRINIYNKYHSKGLYPFHNGWGGAKVMKDFMPPKNVYISDPVLVKDKIYKFIYAAEDDGKNNLGLARIDFIVNDKIIKFINKDLKPSDTLEINLSSYTGKTINYKIAVWDKALNCSVTETKIFKIEE